MTWRQRLRTALAVVAAVGLAGCAHLPFGDDERAAAPPSAAASAAVGPPAYALEIDAPEPLRAQLLDNLDLARFQRAPATDAVDATELERLVRAAPAQVRGLLETEGYFNARVEAERNGEAAGLPRVQLRVEPGPRATVAAVSLDAAGDLKARAAAGDAAAVAEIAALRTLWPMAIGQPFRQADWSSAKLATLARARADGYAAATWSSTNARVDAAANRADLAVVIDSGPLFHFGAIRIEGLERYDAETVRRLATFSPGDPSREQTLLDFQDRLQKLGLFESASVTLDTEAATADAAPVVVRVREQTAQQATVGLGYSANTGPRATLEHTDRGLFGTRWTARSKLELGPLNRTISSELTSFPLADLYRNLLSGGYSSLLVNDQQVDSWNLRVGRSQQDTRIERLYYAQIDHARLDGDQLTSNADAVSLNANWIFRKVDNVLLPTRGYTTALQVGAGQARGSRSVLSAPLETARGPFARLYARLTWYEPLGGGWYGTARGEAGEVLTKSAVGVPDTLLFRAGGEDSVRGYAYRELGPSIAGVTLSGRALATGSVEVARPILAQYPALWGAVFVDAGNAADRWSALKPAFGYGLGVRYRSPVGPLRVDVAYGQDDKRVRVHFSVGVTF